MLVFLSSTVCGHCIEINRNSSNQNKGQITLKISPWGRTSLAIIQRFGLFLLKTVANKILKMHCEQKSIYFEVVNGIPIEYIISLMKY